MMVFPACAGMFLEEKKINHSQHRFPRVRGDVPKSPSQSPQHLKFSPRARGCSVVVRVHQEVRGVFPACAGMFLVQHPLHDSEGGFPRVRGDVPKNHENPQFPPTFSPRARGCSWLPSRRIPP